MEIQMGKVGKFLTFLVLRFMTGPEVGVMVTDGVIDKFEDDLPSMTVLPWMKGVRDEVPVVRVAPPGNDCLGNGKHCAWLSLIDDCLKQKLISTEDEKLQRLTL
jgi:hypothetical protein